MPFDSEKQARTDNQWVHRWVCQDYVQNAEGESHFSSKEDIYQERNILTNLEYTQIFSNYKTVPWFQKQKRMTKAQQAACIREYHREHNILLFVHPTITPQAWHVLVYLRRRWLQNMSRMLTGGYCPIIQEEIAPLLGASRQSLNYYLRIFEKFGVLQRLRDPPKWATGHNSTYIKISYGLLSGNIEKFFQVGNKEKNNDN